MTNEEDIEKSIKAAIESELTDTQQEAKNVLISILSTLENASVMVFSDEEKPKFSAGDVPDEVWELFIKDNLTANPELNEKETFIGFLRRHHQIFLEINNLINIKIAESKKVKKLLRQLKNKNWEKLFCTVQNCYVNKEQQENILNFQMKAKDQEAKDIVSSILITLENASVMSFSDEKKPKFSANDEQADKAWELFVKRNLTANPKLKKYETFHNYLQRHRLIFSEINDLKNMKVPDGNRVFQLLYLLIEKNWDKLFYTVLNCYLNSKVCYEEQIQSFNINYKSRRYQGRTLVHAAVKQNIGILQELIKWGADLEASIWVYNADAEAAADSGGFTPLHYAANGSYSCMKILIQEGVDVNVVTKDLQESALHLAAAGGFIKCVKLLVDSGAKLDGKNFNQKKIPYELALEKGHKHCAQYLAVAMQLQGISLPGHKSSKDEDFNAVELLPMGMSLTAPTKDTSTDVPLHHAVSYENLARIISLLDTSSIRKLRRVNHFFSTITKESYIWGKYVKENLTANPRLLRGEIFYNFLKRHEKILSKYQESKQQSFTPIFDLLCEITSAGWEKLFITVLDNNPGFSVNAYVEGQRRRYLVHCVVAGDNVVMLEKLIERKADLSVRTAGHIAHDMGGDWVENCGNNPLQEAVEAGAHQCVPLLLTYKNQYNINQCASDDHGHSALHLAAKNGDLTSIKLLVTHGALLDQKNGKGNIPYQVAKSNEHEDCANYLAKKMHEKNIEIPKENWNILQYLW